MTSLVDPVELRQGVLAVSVLDEIDITPQRRCVMLHGFPEVSVPWSQLEAVCGTHRPTSATGRRRLGTMLRLARWLGDAGPAAAERLLAAITLIAVPEEHVDHLGSTWCHAPVPGGALTLGLAVRGVPLNAGGTADGAGPSLPLPLPDGILAASGANPADCWAVARSRVERAAARAAEQLRYRLVGREGGVLRPVGGCDVLTLLAGGRLRGELATMDGVGMRAVAVPNRTRGWVDVARIDPAYVGLAWRLTDEVERGVDSPLLVTRDEITRPARQGDLVRHAVEAHRPL